jgi:hypothetical protein
MSTKTKRRLKKFGHVSKSVVFTTIRAFADAVELVMIDLAHSKAKYRKRGSKMRPIIHRTYYRTVVVRERSPLPERAHVVRGNR